MDRATRLVVCALALVWMTGGVMADEEGARKYINEAKEAIEADRAETAETKLKLAETQLDGLDAAKKKALEAEIASLRKQATEAVMAEERIRVVSQMKSRMNKVTSAADNASRADEVLFQVKETEAYLADPEVKKLLGQAEVDKYLKELAAYKKIASAASMEGNLKRLKEALSEMEGKTAERLKAVEKNDGQTQFAVRDFYSDVERIERALKDLPAEDAKVKAEAERLKKMREQFDPAVAKMQTGDALRRMKEHWDSEAKYFEGWEKETATPAFKEAVNGSGPESFKAAKTAEMIRRTTHWLEIQEQNESLKPLMGDPQIKGMIDAAKKAREEGTAKVLKVIESVVAEGEKTTLDKSTRERVLFMQNSVESTLPREHPKVAEYKGRLQKMMDKFDAEVAAKEKAAKELYQQFCKEAVAAWPALNAQYSGVIEDFDPSAAASLKGKLVRLKGYTNRMGWDYTSPNFPFATTHKGFPIAATYSPEVLKVIEGQYEKTGHAIGREEHEIIAVVEGMAKLNRRDQRESEVRVGTESARVTTDVTTPVDAALIRIIGLHAGPVAVAANPGGGVLGASVGGGGGGGAAVPLVAAAPITSGGGGGAGAWTWRVLTLLLGLIAALAALLKANFAPLAATPQGAAINAKVGGERLAYIGIACAVLGLVWLIRGWFIFGLLVSLAIIAAGLYAALDLLEAKGIVKPELAAKVRPLGVQIGLACAAVVVLQLITGGKLIVI